MRLSIPRPTGDRGRGPGRFRILVVLLSFGIAAAGPAAAPVPRDDPEVFEAIEAALAEGNADDVLGLAGRQVALSVPGKKGTLYSKAQAVYVLQDFFKSHPPAPFQFEERESIDDRLFAFGTYATRGKEETFKLSVSLRRRGESWELRELRIEAP